MQISQNKLHSSKQMVYEYVLQHAFLIKSYLSLELRKY
jgi:hypothetical protein